MLDASYVGENTTVIDVGINVDENGKLCGDVAAETLEEKSGTGGSQKVKLYIELHKPHKPYV